MRYSDSFTFCIALRSNVLGNSTHDFVFIALIYLWSTLKEIIWFVELIQTAMISIGCLKIGQIRFCESTCVMEGIHGFLQATGIYSSVHIFIMDTLLRMDDGSHTGR